MVKFREIETELVVDVTGLPLWEGEPALAMITYPNGRQYAMRYETVWKHFVQLPDQAVPLAGSGGAAFERPTRKQAQQ